MRGSVALALSLGTTAVVAAAAVGLAAQGQPTPQAVVPSPVPVYATLEASDTLEAQPGTLTVARGPVARVPAAGGSGLVTAVSIAPGDVARDGTELFRLDGVPIYALVADSPLFRPLSSGSRGPDVATLQRFLSAHVDKVVRVTGTFDRSTRRAVEQMEVNAGLARTGTAQPWWFVRIAERVRVGAVHAQVGHPAPALGETLLVSASDIDSVDVVTDRPPRDGSYRFSFAGGDVELTLTEGAWTAGDVTALTVLPAPAEGEPTGASGEGQDEDGGAGVEGRLALATPLHVVVVPPSALVPSESGGSACLWARDGGVTSRVQGIEVIGVTPSGAAMVSDTSLVGVEALLDPQTHIPGMTCP